MNTERPNFKPSIDAVALAEVLKGASIGSIIDYATLNKAINADVQNGARPALNSARKIALNEHGMVFGTVTNVGLKRLPGGEVVEQERGAVRRIRRSVKRSMSRLSTVDYDALKPDDQASHRLTSAMLGAVALCTGRKTQQKLLEPRAKSDSLSVGDVLKILGRGESMAHAM